LIYQQRLRLEAAKRLLEDGNRSFDEITYQVGYEDSSSFRKVFFKTNRSAPDRISEEIPEDLNIVGFHTMESDRCKNCH
jgi:transcriptional regulator GlxA family with amidase domain